MKDPIKHIEEIWNILEKSYPDARLLLNFQNPLELLIASILAALCTDEKVNQITRELFKKYPTALDYADSDLQTLEKEIWQTGFYRQKAKSIKGCARKLVDEFNEEVPDNLKDLLKCQGVGRKTANLVLGNAFHKPALPVDTHVKRVAQRLGLTTHEDPDKIEEDLTQLLPKERWLRFSHLLGFHGRKGCAAKKPICPTCFLREYCLFVNL